MPISHSKPPKPILRLIKDVLMGHTTMPFVFTNCIRSANKLVSVIQDLIRQFLEVICLLKHLLLARDHLLKRGFGRFD